MIITDFAVVKKNYLYEGLDLDGLHTVKLWEHAGRELAEAQLTLPQIQQLFATVEKDVTAGGNNRTMLGKGSDAAGAVGRAWEDLKTKVSTSGPVKNVDALYDQAAEKLKQATGGDQGVMKYVQKYRDFAKKHPVAQSLIYSALIAAAGISGAGLGGAAALGLFKLVDKLLQGEKFSCAAYSGAKTGGMAYAAGQIGQALQGQTPAAPGTTDAVSTAVPTDLSAIRQQATKEAMAMVQDTLANAVDPVSQGELANVAQAVLEKYTTLQGGPLSVQTAETLAQKIAMQAAAQAGKLNESVDLTESQIYLLVGNVVTRYNSQVNEGVLDSIKGAAGKAANWAQTKSTNLMNKVTADKLMQAWKKAGSPTDSLDVAKIIQTAGVPSATIKQVYNTMKIPFAGEPGAQPTMARKIPVDRQPVAAPATTSANAATPAATAEPSLDLLKRATASLQGGPALSAAELQQVNSYRKSQGAPAIPGPGPATFNAANVTKLPGMQKPAAQAAPTTSATPAAKSSGVEIPVPSGAVNPDTGLAWLPSELAAARARIAAKKAQKAAVDQTAQDTETTPASLPQATSSTAPAPTSVKYKSNLAPTKKASPNFTQAGFSNYKLPGTPTVPTVPNMTQAPAKPSAPAAPAAAATEPSAMGNMAQQLAAKGQAQTSTGGATIATGTGIRHAASPVNPNQAVNQAPQTAEKIAVDDITNQVNRQMKLVKTKDDLKNIKQLIDRQFAKHGLVSESAFAKRDQLIKRATKMLLNRSN